MFIAIITTIYFALAFAGFFVLADKDALPINEEKSPLYAILSATVAALYLWWVVSTLGWIPVTVLLLIWNIGVGIYTLTTTIVARKIYYPTWMTLVALGLLGWLTVDLWIAAVR